LFPWLEPLEWRSVGFWVRRVEFLLSGEWEVGKGAKKEILG
jgi:hypothetical protein